MRTFSKPPSCPSCGAACAVDMRGVGTCCGCNRRWSQRTLIEHQARSASKARASTATTAQAPSPAAPTVAPTVAEPKPVATVEPTAKPEPEHAPLVPRPSSFETEGQRLLASQAVRARCSRHAPPELALSDLARVHAPPTAEDQAREQRVRDRLAAAGIVGGALVHPAGR